MRNEQFAFLIEFVEFRRYKAQGNGLIPLGLDPELYTDRLIWFVVNSRCVHTAQMKDRLAWKPFAFVTWYVYNVSVSECCLSRKRRIFCKFFNNFTSYLNYISIKAAVSFSQFTGCFDLVLTLSLFRCFLPSEFFSILVWVSCTSMRSWKNTTFH